MSTLETNLIQPATGTALQVGASGDTITIPSGATLTNSGTATGFNNPSFFGKLAGGTTIAVATATKITAMTSAEIDTNTAFDGTTFTVPAGEGGNYIIFGQISFDFSSVGSDGNRVDCLIYKNGSELFNTRSIFSSGVLTDTALPASIMTTLAATDTIELYGYTTQASGTGAVTITAGYTYFGGYKIGT